MDKQKMRLEAHAQQKMNVDYGRSEILWKTGKIYFSHLYVLDLGF